MLIRRFTDRAEAGQRLGRRLSAYWGRPGALVLALPRGGVPVGFEVARALGAPLDVLVVRKLGVPGHEELAMGAVASGGVRVLNDGLMRELGIPLDAIERVCAAEQQELERRERAFRGSRPRPAMAGRTVILVDDGLATGATMRAAVRAVRTQHPARLVVAVPVSSMEASFSLTREADEFVSLYTPDPFYAISPWYDDFAQVPDEEVRELLERAASRTPTATPAS